MAPLRSSFTFRLPGGSWTRRGDVAHCRVPDPARQHHLAFNCFSSAAVEAVKRLLPPFLRGLPGLKRARRQIPPKTHGRRAGAIKAVVLERSRPLHALESWHMNGTVKHVAPRSRHYFVSQSIDHPPVADRRALSSQASHRPEAWFLASNPVVRKASTACWAPHVPRPGTCRYQSTEWRRTFLFRRSRPSTARAADFAGACRCRAAVGDERARCGGCIRRARGWRSDHGFRCCK